MTMPCLKTRFTAGTYGKCNCKIAKKIVSYLDYDSLLKARTVSKTWYKYFELLRSRWSRELRTKYRKAKDKLELEINSYIPQDDSEIKQWKKLVREVDKNGSV